MRLGLELRREPRFDRSYRRNVGDVYHYALGVLSDPLDAEEVTHTTFRNAELECARLGRSAPDRDSLFAIAHEVCRIRGGHPRLTETDLLEEHAHAGPCHDAEKAISRRADGRLSRRERRDLRRHLSICGDCRSFAQLQEAQRGAVAVLAAAPLPKSLEPRKRARRPRLRVAARLGALAATAALVLALAASGGIPSPGSFIGKEQGPEAEAGLEREQAKRKFQGRAASDK